MNYSLVHYGLMRFDILPQHIRSIYRVFGLPVSTIGAYWRNYECSTHLENIYDRFDTFLPDCKIVTQLQKKLTAVQCRSSQVYSDEYYYRGASQILALKNLQTVLSKMHSIPKWLVLTRPDIIAWGSIERFSQNTFDYFYSMKHCYYPDALVLIRSDLFMNIQFLDTDSLVLFDSSIESLRHAMLQRESNYFSFQRFSYAVHRRDKLPYLKLPMYDLIKTSLKW